MDPRRETEDAALLDEEQIRSDERARIERQRTIPTEADTARERHERPSRP